MDESLLLFSGCTFSLLSIVLATVAYKCRRNGIEFRATCMVARGEVVALIEVQCDEPPNMWAPKIRFITQQGHFIEFQTSSSCYPPEYRVGQKLEVWYPPDEPEAALTHADAFDYDSWMPLAAAAAGTIIIGMAAFWNLWMP